MIWGAKTRPVEKRGPLVRDNIERVREKIFIDEREKDEIMKGMQDSFLSSSLSYLSHSDFPQKYVLKEFNEKIKKGSWYKDI